MGDLETQSTYLRAENRLIRTDYAKQVAQSRSRVRVLGASVADHVGRVQLQPARQLVSDFSVSRPASRSGASSSPLTYSLSEYY